MRRPATLAVVLLAAVGLAWPQQRVERRVPARSGVTVSVENIAGSVTITGWNRDEVEVIASLGRSVEDLDISADGDEVSIEVEIFEHERRVDDTDLEIRVPYLSHLDVETVSARLVVEDVEGDMELETVSGTIKVSGSPRELDVASVSGSIDIVSRRPVADTDIESVSGNISLEAELDSGADIDIETVSGSVTLRLPGSLSARFEVSSFSGGIDNDFGPEARRRSQYVPARELEFSVGGGHSRISIETLSGRIRLLRN